jgi:hypothetical protein
MNPLKNTCGGWEENKQMKTRSEEELKRRIKFNKSAG